MATCPECGGNIPTDNVERGEIVPCPDCGAELEVRSAPGEGTSVQVLAPLVAPTMRPALGMP